jgi:hypothetical protein
MTPYDIICLRTKNRIKKQVRNDTLILFAGITHITTLTSHSTPLRSAPISAIMPESCIMCSAVAATRLQIRSCGQCMSAMYCSKACQKKDWRPRHKRICKLLSVGHGGMQVRNEIHTSRQIAVKEKFERNEQNLHEGMKGFFKLFQESTFGGSRVAALEMEDIAKRQTKDVQTWLLFHSFHYLVRSSNSEKLSWPNSPLLVLLQIVDPNVLVGDEESSGTALHVLAQMADPFDYRTHENQLILAKQLIEHGANVNAVTDQDGVTPLHNACSWYNVTNLDFVKLLLKNGADPNCQNHLGYTPLMYTTKHAPGAAKFLLNWPTTDVNITDQSGESFLARVRRTIEYFSQEIALPDNPEQIQHQLLLQQWSEIEDMVVKRGALTAIE